MNDQPSRPRFRRPAILDPASLDEFGVGHLDPALISQIAHDTAAAIVGTGRFRADPELTERLVAITDDIGLDTVARLWADRPARSLPGALWRLYVLREWVRRDPAGASTDYRGGQVYADVAAVVAGAAGAPGPQELQELTDAIVRGIYQGDVAVALDRAAAFCRVVAAGRAARDDAGVLAKEQVLQPVSPSVSTSSTRGRPELRDELRNTDRQGRSAAALLRTADDLTACASLWRRGDLH